MSSCGGKWRHHGNLLHTAQTVQTGHNTRLHVCPYPHAVAVNHRSVGVHSRSVAVVAADHFFGVTSPSARITRHGGCPCQSDASSRPATRCNPFQIFITATTNGIGVGSRHGIGVRGQDLCPAGEWGGFFLAMRGNVSAPPPFATPRAALVRHPQPHRCRRWHYPNLLVGFDTSCRCACAASQRRTHRRLHKVRRVWRARERLACQSRGGGPKKKTQGPPLPFFPPPPRYCLPSRRRRHAL